MRATLVSLVTGVVVVAVFWWQRSNTERISLESCKRAAGADAQRDDDVLLQCQRFLSARGPDVAVTLARVYRKRGQDDAVLALANEAQAGDVWSLAAVIFTERGDLERAREANKRALELHRRNGQIKRALRAAYELYTSYWATSELEQALHYVDLALAEAVRTNDRIWQWHVLQSLFMILLDIGDLAAAEIALRQSRELTEPADTASENHVRFNEGVLRAERGELEAARAAYEDILTRVPADHRLWRFSRFNLIELHLDLGQIERAGEHLDAMLSSPPAARPKTKLFAIALSYFHALVSSASGENERAEELLTQALERDPPADWTHRLYHAIARARQQRGDDVGAEAAYREAIRSVEGLRRSLGNGELKAWLLREKRAPFEDLFTLLARRGDMRGALEILEQAKARSFLDAFIEAASDRRPAADAGVDTAGAIARARGLRDLLPAVRATQVVENRPIEQVLESVADRHALGYFIAGSRLWLLQIGSASGAEPRLRALDIAPEAVAEHVAAMIADPGDQQAAEALGRALLPADVLPPAGRRLYLIADGVLGELPFAALRVGGQYLVERHALAHIPSLNALSARLAQERAPHGEPVVLGDGRSDLPGAAAEARAVAASLGVTAAVGERANSHALRKGARARVLHLASHAGIGDRGAWVALADGEVHADAIVRWRLGPQLVVLASCMSGSSRGPGMWGSLGAAFLASGSDAVLVTLWSVDDQDARQFVSRFYAEGGARDPAGALARAQRALVAEGASPTVWAPFVLFGRVEPLPAN